MRLYDISRPLLQAPTYPGDPAPALSCFCDFSQGAAYRISALSLCCHSATHLDAPLHVFPAGESVEQLDLRRCMGQCLVEQVRGEVSADEVERLCLPQGGAVLWKEAEGLTLAAAERLAQAGVSLVGVERLSIAQGEHELAVHRCLLGAGVLILEGLCLREVPPGRYFLLALPLRIEGAEAAPVRAVLLSAQEDENGLLGAFFS